MTIFVVSDQHFGHKNILTFKDEYGDPVRRFDSVEEMDEYIVAKHNAVVSVSDHVYFLGDVFFGGGHVHIGRLNGRKRLIPGNHDELTDERLTRHFQKIAIWRIFKEYNCVLTHIPIHESGLYKVDFNVHGHIHQQESPTPHHINACVEKHDYSPIPIEQLMKGRF